MSYLTRILRAIALARTLFSSPTNYSATPNFSAPTSVPSAPEPAPPDEPELIDDGYDPRSEVEIIMTPLSDDPLFYHVHCAQAAADILYRKAEYWLHDLNWDDLRIIGAETEGKLMMMWIKPADRNFYHFRYFRIHGYPLLAAQHINNDSQDWYYCTVLELPQGMFGEPLITFRRPAKQLAQKRTEELLDRSRSSGDQK